MREPVDTDEDDRKVGKKPKRKKVKRIWWRRKRTILLALLVGFYGWPIVNPFSPQDRCEFGTGSLDLHQQMKKEARAYLKKNGRVWMGTRKLGSSHADAIAFSRGLGSQISEFAMQRPTATERTAALHTLLRKYQMEFRENRPTRAQMLNPTDFPQYRFIQSYLYRSKNYLLSPICPLCYLSIHGGFSALVRDEQGGQGDFRVRADGTGLCLLWTMNWSHVAAKSSGFSCPQILR